MNAQFAVVFRISRCQRRYLMALCPANYVVLFLFLRSIITNPVNDSAINRNQSPSWLSSPVFAAEVPDEADEDLPFFPDDPSFFVHFA